MVALPFRSLLMPTYEYECQSCHLRIEAVQKFSDASLTTCENCGGDLRKVFSAVGIVFKGSGFYKNDSRSSSSSSSSAPSTPSTPTPSTAPTPAAAAAPAAAPAGSAAASSGSSPTSKD
jgi:putative FmdB family regulatory protein